MKFFVLSRGFLVVAGGFDEEFLEGQNAGRAAIRPVFNVILALQGAIALRSAAAALAVPALAVEMHMGYGIGYLGAIANGLWPSWPARLAGRPARSDSRSASGGLS